MTWLITPSLERLSNFDKWIQWPQTYRMQISTVSIAFRIDVVATNFESLNVKRLSDVTKELLQELNVRKVWKCGEGWRDLSLQE